MTLHLWIGLSVSSSGNIQGQCQSKTRSAVWKDGGEWSIAEQYQRHSEKQTDDGAPIAALGQNLPVTERRSRQQLLQKPPITQRNVTLAEAPQ